MGEHLKFIFQALPVTTSACPAVHHIALVGNALPRRCGLATYSSHVADALHGRFPDMTVDHYAMDDGTGVVYPADIRTIVAADPGDYERAAARIEASGAEAVWLQHEFGIFGGEAGRHILGLVDRLAIPLIVTLHTVLEKPSAAEREVFDHILRRASHLIVMAERGRTILRDLYGVDADRISVIPHGVPDRPYVDPDSVKARYGLEGREVIMTFGLLAPDKGIRFMIEAMAKLVLTRPNCHYVVIGATHPNLIRDQGEALRESLMDRAAELGVADHITFVDAFLEQEELLDWLQAADVYVTPYLNLGQITSGTLSYAVALGKPVVSTPYLHAVEMLSECNGIIVPPHDADALAEEIAGLLHNDARRRTMAQEAYLHGREILWPRAVERAIGSLAPFVTARSRSVPTHSLLPVSLDAVVRMTDSTGMLQHGVYSIPDRHHGYCIDDNARALILASRMEGGDPALIDRLSTSYAAFIQHGWNPDRRRFRNFMRYDRGWCEDVGSDDSNGRTLWSLGVTAAHGHDRAMRDWALDLFNRTAAIAQEVDAPRAKAFAMLGAAEILSVHPDHTLAIATLEHGAAVIQALFDRYRKPDWTWFEPVLAYDNARLPEALIRAGRALGRADWLQTGIATLEWLLDVQTSPGGTFRPVGNESFGRPHSAPLPFDQQPLEAQATIDACMAAHQAQAEERWLDAALWSYGWFMGANDLGEALATPQDGGCFDGLTKQGANRNQGAESILALQLSNVAIAGIARRAAHDRARDAA